MMLVVERQNMDRLLGITCRVLEVDRSSVRGRSRLKPYNEARCIMYVVMRRAGMSNVDIAEYFGRDHSTISTVVNDWEASIASDPSLRRTVACIEGEWGHRQSIDELVTLRSESATVRDILTAARIQFQKQEQEYSELIRRMDDSIRRAS
jgi:transposase